jgi:hypothetical protein
MFRRNHKIFNIIFNFSVLCCARLENRPFDNNKHLSFKMNSYLLHFMLISEIFLTLFPLFRNDTKQNKFICITCSVQSWRRFAFFMSDIMHRFIRSFSQHKQHNKEVIIRNLSKYFTMAEPFS